MYLDYSTIELDANGSPVRPLLKLQRLSEENLGILNGVHDLSFNICFSEPSEISFTIPYSIDGVINPLYKEVSGYRVVHTKNYGVYLLTTPTTEGNGLEEVKSVKGYSIEKTFERKDLFLAEGVYCLYDTFDQENTIMARILELDSSWVVRHVDSSLYGRYRTFDQYKGNALNFLYGDMMEKYRCLAVFDPYKGADGKRGIYLYDADADISTLPIYLSYENVLQETKVTELSDELITKLHVYGADDLSIIDVNPMGVDYLVNLDHFIENGDISTTLAQKVRDWQSSIDANREYFSGLTALRATSTAKKIALEAELVDLNGELSVLKEEQSAIIEGINLNKKLPNGTTTSWEDQLATKTQQITAKEAEISEAKETIETVKNEIDGYADSISDIVSELRYKGEKNDIFETVDYDVLDQYLIEDTVSEETFVATDIDTQNDSEVSTLTGAVSISDSAISMVSLSDYGRTMYSITSGKVTIASKSLNAKIIRGTVEWDRSTNKYVCSFYLGACAYGDKTHPSGMLTITGTLSSFSTDVSAKTTNGVTVNEGTRISFNTTSASCFFTKSVTDYQKYSVQKELYDFGVEILEEKARMTYEFSIDSANFLFSETFAGFKDQLEFGKAIHLMLGSNGRVDATFIGIDLDFDDVGTVGLVFSNRFQRHDGKTKLKQLLDKTYSSSRSFDASKYLYKQTANKTSQVEDFINESLDLAASTIRNSNNQSIMIDSSGINIGGDNAYQLRMMNSMIAMTNDGWQSTDMAIGLINGKMQVNADVLAGNLFVGENLMLQNYNSDGVMQFLVDKDGAKINNGVISMTNDAGGQVLIDPKYGFMAGTSSLFDVSEDGVITPSFMVNGKFTMDDDNMPLNANFYLDNATGEAYFRGKVVAGSGDIGGWQVGEAGTSTAGRLYSGSGGSYVALNTSTVNDPLYAIWAGGQTPASSKFYVKKDGTVKVKGAIDASSFSINGETALDSADQIKGDFLNLKGVLVGPENDPNFYVDANGNVTIKGKITMGTGSSINWNNVNETNASASDAYSLANSAKEEAKTATLNANEAKTRADAATVSMNNILYEGSTYIDGSKIYTGSITTNKLAAGTLEGFTIISPGDWGDITISDSMIWLGSSGKLYGDDLGNMFIEAPSIFRIYMGRDRYFEFSGAGINYYRSDDGGVSFELISYAQFNPV